jgi:hypothetical protein
LGIVAHQVVATDLLFADLAPDQSLTTYGARSGRLFLVTSNAFVIADYRNAAEDADQEPNQDFGTLDLTLHPRRPDSIAALRWPARSLRIPVDRFGGRPTGMRLEPGSLRLEGYGWAVDLPGHVQDDATGTLRG